jgi:hypothetical protein
MFILTLVRGGSLRSSVFAWRMDDCARHGIKHVICVNHTRFAVPSSRLTIRVQYKFWDSMSLVFSFNSSLPKKHRVLCYAMLAKCHVRPYPFESNIIQP